jgi:hypothetical protein
MKKQSSDKLIGKKVHIKWKSPYEDWNWFIIKDIHTCGLIKLKRINDGSEFWCCVSDIYILVEVNQ